MKNEPSYFDAVLSLVGGQLSGPGSGPVEEFIFTDKQTPKTKKKLVIFPLEVCLYKQTLLHLRGFCLEQVFHLQKYIV